MQEVKKCTKCGEEVDIEKYHKDPIQKNGLHCWCPSCRKESGKKRWQRKRDDGGLEELLNYYHTQRGKYSALVSRCNKHNLNLEIDFEQFKEYFWDKNCYYCGDKILTKTGIDRVDNKIGYTMDNCVPCCSKCNVMKHILSKSDFFSHIQKIYNKHTLGVSPLDSDENRVKK